MREIAASEAAPSVTRVVGRRRDGVLVRDEEGAGGSSTSCSRPRSRRSSSGARATTSSRCASAFIGYEGTRAHVKRAAQGWSGEIVAKHGGICIGTSPGELYDQKKFDTPYIRDFLLDRGALADVSETAAPWSELPPLYDGVIGRGPRRVRRARRPGLHHVPPVALATTRARACTSRSRSSASSRRDGLEQYDVVKSRDPAGVRRQRRHALAPPRGRHRARRRGSSRTSRRRASAMLRALFDGDRPGRQPQPGQDRVSEPPELDVAWARSAPARVVREAVLVGILGPLMDIYTRRR